MKTESLKAGQFSMHTAATEFIKVWRMGKGPVRSKFNKSDSNGEKTFVLTWNTGCTAVEKERCSKPRSSLTIQGSQFWNIIAQPVLWFLLCSFALLLNLLMCKTKAWHLYINGGEKPKHFCLNKLDNYTTKQFSSGTCSSYLSKRKCYAIVSLLGRLTCVIKSILHLWACHVFS